MLKTNADYLRSKLAPLYTIYPGRLHPQPAYVVLDTVKRRLTAYSDYDPTDIPIRVQTGEIKRFPINPGLRGDVIADLLHWEYTQELAEAIIEGENTNRLEAWLKKALNTLGADGLADIEYAEEWMPETYNYEITPDTTEEEIAVLADELLEQATKSGVHIADGVHGIVLQLSKRWHRMHGHAVCR